MLDGPDLPQGACSQGVGKVISRKGSKASVAVVEDDGEEVISLLKAPTPTLNATHTSSKAGTGSGAVRSFQTLLQSQDSAREAREKAKERMKEEREREMRQEQRMYEERRQEQREKRDREKRADRMEAMESMQEMNRQTTLMLARQICIP